jgi:hypothetical protein
MMMMMMILIITQWSGVVAEKLTGIQLLKKLSLLNGTQNFISAITKARLLSLFRVKSIQSMPLSLHFSTIHFDIILPSTPGS